MKMLNTGVTTTKSGSGKALSYTRFKNLAAQLGTFPGYSKDPAKASSLPSASSVTKIVLPEASPDEIIEEVKST